MKKALGVLIIGLCGLTGAWAAEVPVELTLDEAVAIALRDNRDILRAAGDVQKAKAKIAEAQSALWPSLTVTSGWTYTRGYYSKDLGQVSGQMTLMQTLYRGGKTINTIRQSGHNFTVAQALLDKAKLETVFAVKKAFDTLCLAEEFVTLNSRIVENTRGHLAAVRAQYDRGQAPASEVLTLQQSLASVEQVAAASQYQRQAAEALLCNLLFLDEQLAIRAKGTFSYVPREVAFDQALLAAMSRRPQIRQYEAQEAADKNALEIVKAEGRPAISASWDYYTRSHAATSIGVVRNQNDYNIIGLTFSWPVFDGWETKAKLEQALVDLKATQLLQEKTAHAIALEVRNAYLGFKDALERIKATEAELLRYQDNLAVADRKYQEGILSSLDLDDARLRYEVAVFSKTQALYDYELAKVVFDQATGVW